MEVLPLDHTRQRELEDLELELVLEDLELAWEEVFQALNRTVLLAVPVVLYTKQIATVATRTIPIPGHTDLIIMTI